MRITSDQGETLETVTKCRSNTSSSSRFKVTKNLLSNTKLKPVTAAQWQPIEAAFMALKDKCGGILNLSIGPNISPERAGGKQIR